MTKADIVSLARRLGKEVRRDPFLLAKREGVTVSFCPFRRQLGAYVLADGIPLLLLNGRLSPERTRQVCAHEMGHHFLHRDTLLPLTGGQDTPFTRQTEREAELFAAAFLRKAGEFPGESGTKS